MRGIFYFFFIAVLVHPMRVVAAPNMGEMILGGTQIPSGPAPMPQACELVEQTLIMRLQMFGWVEGQPPVPMLAQQAGQARTFRELARRGCLPNRPAFAIQYRAALEVAWALLDIEYPAPTVVETNAQGTAIDPRVAERRRWTAELREIERAPISQGW